MSTTDILRGNYVRRCHANPDLAHVGDTNGHHQASVAQIVFHLMPDATINLIHAALHHDSAEQFVGDLPQPFKAVAPDFAEMHASIETAYLADIGADTSEQLTPINAKILKLADRLAAYLHVRHVAPHILAAYGWPQDRERLIGMAWSICPDVGAKVEAMLA